MAGSSQIPGFLGIKHQAEKARIPPTIDGRELTLEVEFRFPNTCGLDRPPTSEGDWQFTFATLSGQARREYRDGTIQTAAAHHENGQWIVPTQVELFTERGGRSVTRSLDDGSCILVLLARENRDWRFSEFICENES